MEKKDILLIAHFCSDFNEVSNNRFNYLAKLLAKNNCKVELVTSDFSHKKKKRKDQSLQYSDYKMTYIKEPGYNRNVSLKRLYSHNVMSRNLGKYLENRKVPDIIYCAVPSIDVAKVASKYASKYNVRFIIDVQDLWPEAFKLALNTPIISHILFYPMKKQADYVYSAADDVIAVSETYAERVQKANRKGKSVRSVYLGTDLGDFDEMAKMNKNLDKPTNEIWLAYIGTLGHSYDLTTVIDALKVLKGKGINNLKFIVMGDGPLRSKFEVYASAKEVSVEFTGRLEYSKMAGLLISCDIAINPIKADSAGSILNKVGDYAAAGLPVINTQDCMEYRNLLEEYRSGINCNNEDSEDIANQIYLLYKDRDLRSKMGRQSRRLAIDVFDRRKTYLNIVSSVLKPVK